MTKKVKVVYKRNAPVTLLTLGQILLPQYRGPDWCEVRGTQVGEPSLELRANEAPLVHFAVLPFTF